MARANISSPHARGTQEEGHSRVGVMQTDKELYDKLIALRTVEDIVLSLSDWDLYVCLALMFCSVFQMNLDDYIVLSNKCVAK